MNPAFQELLEDLPSYLGGHLLLSLAALTVGLAVSVPLGIAVSRRPRLAEWALVGAGIIQTIPSLALLALMVPLLGGTIGFAPAFVAMTLYSFLPILANTVIGIKGVDPALTEAARGLGMSDRQMLWRVQLPLAAPVILSGIRTATVLVVGTATLATPVGETTLGNYIFAGLNTRDHFATVFGCVCAALLAVVLDQLVHLLELAARRRSRGLAWAGALGLLLVLGGGLYDPVARLLSPPPNPVLVGSADYTEQHILSEVLKQHLQSVGFTVEQRKGMGETIEFDSLRAGEIDCYVDYSGNIWATLMKRKDFKDRQTILSEITDYLRDRHGVTCLGSLGFEDAYALAMPRRRARELNVRTLADLAEQAPALTIAGDLQFFRRPEWGSVRQTYGLTFRETKPMDPTLMYSAVSGHSPSVDVICAYTSDGRIAAHDLLILDDPQHVFPPYDAVLLVSPRAVNKPGFIEALQRLVGAIDVKMMREANRQVDVDGRRPRQAGTELWTRIQK
ncbi:MAG TPA: ABC transporter permease/substrate-binding protein [Gemmataceae bacterium]